MALDVLRRSVVVYVLIAGNVFCHATENKEQLGDTKPLPVGGLEVIYKGDIASPRITYATEQVRIACNEVAVGVAIDVSIQGSDVADRLKPEGFRLKSLGDHSFSIVGADQSGVLYGCLELADRIRAVGAMPAKLDVTDAPEFNLRGACIGMQKLQRDPYGGHYQWPYSPKNFPFFYDKEHWREYLDFLVGVRMNCLYLWNGHPFASLVQLEDYPEALEVSPEILEKNREIMYWLTTECDKRGIWLIQMFYNIHLPKGLGLGTSLSRSNPKAADYTRTSIARFVEEYPNVGLLVCLGEALSGKEAQVEWFSKTIIPGMKDGLKARGQTELPPIVVRGHHIVEHGSHKDVLSEGLKLYPNLFSMVKYNGESLTSETPRGKYQQYHKDMAKYSGTHMANVHCLSNLEPFRYADFSFIWNSCKAIRDRLDGNGLHLYPLGYWDWPHTPDKADITQLERDRLWFEIWARYCWKPDRDPAEEREHWIGRLTDIYGTRKAAEKIYAAYDACGECAPRILRRFGITGGNRQCMSLGMFLDQLTDPKKYRVWQELYDSDSPPGETITQYIANEYAGKPHVGETPPQIVKEVLAFAAEAVEQIEAAASDVTTNKEEFERLRNDIHCIDAMTRSYCAKVNAAMMVHRYRHSKDAGYMKKALPLMEESLGHYKRLEALTRGTYRYSNGLHGRQRVPKPAVYHWTQLVGDYEKELTDFREKVAALDGEPATARVGRGNAKPWPAAKFKLLTPGVETYEVKKGAKVFTDRDYALNDIAPQLVGLTGMRFSHGEAKKGGAIRIDFEVAEPVKVLVGYFQEERDIWLQVPMLEHVAHANDRAGIDPVLEDVADIGDAKLKLPKVNVHAFTYAAGRNTLEMIGKGSYVILGVVPADTKLNANAGFVGWRNGTTHHPDLIMDMDAGAVAVPSKLVPFGKRSDQILFQKNHLYVFNGTTWVGLNREHLGVHRLVAPPYIANPFSANLQLFGQEVSVRQYHWYPSESLFLGQAIKGISPRLQVVPLKSRRGALVTLTLRNTTSRPVTVPVKWAINGGPGKSLNWHFGVTRSSKGPVTTTLENNTLTKLCGDARLVASLSGMTAKAEDNSLSGKITVASGKAVKQSLIIVVGDKEKVSVAETKALGADPDRLVREARSYWTRMFEMSDRRLPTLTGASPELQDFYRVGVISVLSTRHEVPEFLFNPYYATSGIDGGAANCYLWDISYAANTGAMLAPEAMRNQITQFFRLDINRCYAFDPIYGKRQGPRYSYNYYNLARLVYTYLAVTGDLGLMKEEIDGKPALTRLYEACLGLEDLSKPPTLLDYGNNHNLLELKRTQNYTHVTPSPNGERILTYRYLTDIYQALGRKTPHDLIRRGEALKKLYVQKLWNGEKQWLNTLDEKRNPRIAYSVQIFDVLRSGMLSEQQEKGILTHLNEKEFLSEWGVYSLARADPGYDPRDVDWGGPGAHSGDPAELVVDLFQAGYRTFQHPVPVGQPPVSLPSGPARIPRRHEADA